MQVPCHSRGAAPLCVRASVLVYHTPKYDCLQSLLERTAGEGLRRYLPCLAAWPTIDFLQSLMTGILLLFFFVFRARLLEL